jgi:hypothetical protein
MFVTVNAGGVEEQAAVPVQVKLTPSDPAKEDVGITKFITSRGKPRRYANS